VHGKLVIAGIGPFFLDFIIVVAAVVFGLGYVDANYQYDAEMPRAIGSLNVAVFFIIAMGFCLIVSGLMVWFIQETGGVNHEKYD